MLYFIGQFLLKVYAGSHFSGLKYASSCTTDGFTAGARGQGATIIKLPQLSNTADRWVTSCVECITEKPIFGIRVGRAPPNKIMLDPFLSWMDTMLNEFNEQRALINCLF